MKLLPEAGNNSFIGNSLSIFLIRFFPSLANVLVLIYFSRQLATAEYGAYQNFWVQLIVLSTIACMGFQAFIITYPASLIASFIKTLRFKHYAAFFLWIMIVAGIFTLLQPRLNVAVPLFFLITYTLSIFAESVLVAFRSFKATIFINLLYTFFFLFLHWLFIVNNWSLETLFSYLLVLTVMKLAALLFTYGQALRIQPEHKGALVVSEVRKLWLHMGVYDTFRVLFTWIDKFVLALFLSEGVFAIYFNGAQEIPFLPLVLGAVGSAALIQLAYKPGSDNKDHIIEVVNKTGKVLSAIVFPLFFFFLFFSTELFGVILTDKYLPSVPVFMISILVIPLRAYSFTTVLQNRHRGDVINKGAILDLLLACALMYPCYLWLGLPGVALSFVVSTYVQAGYYLYHSSHVLDISVFKLIPGVNWLLKLVVFALLFIIIHYLVHDKFSPGNVLLSGCVFTVMVSLVSLWLEIRSQRNRRVPVS